MHVGAAAGFHAAGRARLEYLARGLSSRSVDADGKYADIEKSGGLRRFLFHVVTAKAFEMTIGAVIMFNLAVVIIETDLEAEDQDDSQFAIVNKILLTIYTIELCFKLFIYRAKFFKEYWNCLDFVIVVPDLVVLAIGDGLNDAPSFNFMRIFRLARLLRAFRMASLFPELNLLMKGFFGAVRAIFWGVCMVCLILAVWSILAVKLLNPINVRIADRGDYAGCDRCAHAFSSVWMSALTFFQQVVAGDSWGTVSLPVIEEEWWTAFLFLAVLVSVSLAMLNLILAVICEAATEARQQSANDCAERAMKDMQAHRQKLLELCGEMDNDKSGSVSFNELISGWDQSQEFADTLIAMDVKKEDMQRIFSVLDTDGSGDVRYEEFVDQLHMLKTNESRLILFTVMEIQCKVEERFKALQRNIDRVHQQKEVEVPEDEGKMDRMKELAESSAAQSGQGQLPDQGGQLQETKQQCLPEETSVCGGSLPMPADSTQRLREAQALYSSEELDGLIKSSEELVQAVKAMRTMTNLAYNSNPAARNGQGCAPGLQGEKVSVVPGTYGGDKLRTGALGTAYTVKEYTLTAPVKAARPSSSDSIQSQGPAKTKKGPFPL